jgi:IrrE N-terminal-like domain
MPNSERNSISLMRKRLENPYAYIEHLESVEKQPRGSDSPLSASRRALENPYAYLADNGGYEADFGAQPTKTPLSPTRWTNEQIATKVGELHARLWRERDALWHGAAPQDPIDLLDPGVALEAIGYQFDLEEGLGLMPGGGGQIEVAGIIDTQGKIVRVGRQFPAAVRAFTAAHELAHAVLHPTLSGLHRDKPLDGSPGSADRVEVEANKFATLFLMPERLIRARFAELFQADIFEPSEESIFALSGCSVSDFQRSHRTLRQVSRVVAGAPRFNGRHFSPLNEQFRVSRETMAIRLEELALVRVDA